MPYSSWLYYFFNVFFSNVLVRKCPVGTGYFIFFASFILHICYGSYNGVTLFLFFFKFCFVLFCFVSDEPFLFVCFFLLYK